MTPGALDMSDSVTFGGKIFLARPRVVYGLNSDANPVPAVLTSAPNAISGTIAAGGGTAQTQGETNALRRYCFFQNHSDAEMWIDFGVTAVAGQPSIRIEAGDTWENGRRCRAE